MIYITNDYKNIFFVNFKCCFSTFENMVEYKNLYRLSGKYNNIINSKIKNKIKNDVKLYIITRNPYNRFISFYNDKFKYCFDGTCKDCDKQICQKNIYKYYPEYKIRNLNFEINDLINCIKKGYWDIHLDLQSNIIKNNIFGKQLNYLKMEDQNFNEILQNIIGCKIPKFNSTSHLNKTNILTDSDKLYLFNLYYEDFKQFSYSK